MAAGLGAMFFVIYSAYALAFGESIGSGRKGKERKGNNENAN